MAPRLIGHPARTPTTAATSSCCHRREGSVSGSLSMKAARNSTGDCTVTRVRIPPGSTAIPAAADCTASRTPETSTYTTANSSATRIRSVRQSTRRPSTSTGIASTGRSDPPRREAQPGDREHRGPDRRGVEQVPSAPDQHVLREARDHAGQRDPAHLVGIRPRLHHEEQDQGGDQRGLDTARDVQQRLRHGVRAERGDREGGESRDDLRRSRRDRPDGGEDHRDRGEEQQRVQREPVHRQSPELGEHALACAHQRRDHANTSIRRPADHSTRPSVVIRTHSTPCASANAGPPSKNSAVAAASASIAAGATAQVAA